MKTTHGSRTAAVLLALACVAVPGPAQAQEGDATRQSSLSPAEFEDLYHARTDSARMHFTRADVFFVTGMIGHHAQALIMSDLAPTHGASPQVQTLAARIINAQKDEIAFMQQWLRDRNQPVPEVRIDGLDLMIHMSEPGGQLAHDAQMAHDPDAEHEARDPHAPEAERDPHDPEAAAAAEAAETEEAARDQHAAPGSHDHLMPGMLTQEQLEQLDAAYGPEFDRLFLTGMIHHHGGAVTMVHDLFSVDGAGQDGAVFKLASDIQADQLTEIARMELMLESLTDSEFTD